MTTKMCRAVCKKQDSHFNTTILLSHSSLQRWIQRKAPASTEQSRHSSQCTGYLQRYLRSLLLILRVHLHVHSSASSKEGRLYSPLLCTEKLWFLLKNHAVLSQHYTGSAGTGKVTARVSSRVRGPRGHSKQMCSKWK